MQRGGMPVNDLNPEKLEDAGRARTTVCPEAGTPFSRLRGASYIPRVRLACTFQGWGGVKE